MKYLGGKARIAKQLVAALPFTRVVWEPFCGGLNMTLELAKRYPVVIASDLHPGPPALGAALQRGWQPPTSVSEEEYHAARTLPDSDPLKAFIGFGCSFGGKWFSGYARDNPAHGDFYAQAAGGCCERLRPHLSYVAFECASFFEQAPVGGVLIYCDPPYQNTTGYATGGFDSSAFWSRCQEHVQAGSRVFVSEYAKPPVPAELVWSRTEKPRMQGRDKQVTECLFEVLPV